jgi:signal transduction histidine kinase/CheY-like chemotaxis protein
MDSMINITDDKLGQQRILDSISRIIKYNIKNVDDYVDFIIKEIAGLTSSRNCFYVKSDPENIKPADSASLPENESGSAYCQMLTSSDTVITASWKDSCDQGKVFVHDKPVTLLFKSGGETKHIDVKRLSSFPLKIANYHTYSLTVTDKISPYTELELLSAETIISAAARLIEDFLKAAQLRRAKTTAEEEVNQKNIYINNISHEIKTPVNAIIGFSSLLKENDQTNENRQKFLDIIIESSGNLVSILSSVTEISNFESGLINIIEKPVNIFDLILEVLKPFKENNSPKVVLKTDISLTNEYSLCLADKNKLVHILSNLLSNSFKFTYNGSVTLGCRKDGGFIEFWVADTGVGISDENKAHVFTHFFQAGDSLLKTYKGTGLGLSTSKVYVERMGGKMWFSSAEARGSDFHFTIPYKPVPVLRSDDYKTSADLKGQKDRKKVVLVAEDDHFNFALIKNFLSQHNVEIIRAENGREAVNFCADNKVDLVLMDIRMPVMDGYIATRLIKESEPDMVIIAQTAYTNDRDTALSNGCDDFIAKPFTRQQLISLVENYL